MSKFYKIVAGPLSMVIIGCGVFAFGGCSGPAARQPEAAQTRLEYPPEVPAGYKGETERRWARIYGNHLYDLIRERPLAWLPVGILEHHGEHLPWSLDGQKAYLVCLRLSEKLNGVVLPVSLLAGVHGDRRPEQSEQEYRDFNKKVGDFMFTEVYFRRFMLETYDGLANIGFKVIVAYTGHYPEIQTRIVRETAEQYSATGRATVIPFWEPLACGAGDHGAKWESSIWEALAPGGVRMKAIVDEETGRSGYYRGQEIRSQISREFGEKALDMVENYLTQKIDEAFAGQETNKH